MQDFNTDTEQLDQQQVPQPPKKLKVSEFAAKVRVKYPEYKDIADDVLVDKIVAKYPQYKDKVELPSKKKEEPTPLPVSDGQSPVQETPKKVSLADRINNAVDNPRPASNLKSNNIFGERKVVAAKKEAVVKEPFGNQLDQSLYTTDALDVQQKKLYSQLQSNKDFLSVGENPDLVKKTIELSDDPTIKRNLSIDFIKNEAVKDGLNPDEANLPNIAEYYKTKREQLQSQANSEMVDVTNKLQQMDGRDIDMSNLGLIIEQHPEIKEKLDKIKQLDTYLGDFNKYAHDYAKKQVVDRLDPSKFASKQEYLKTVGREIRKIDDYKGVAKKEEDISTGNELERSKALREKEDYNDELTGINVLQGEINHKYQNGEIDADQAKSAMEDINTQNKTLESRYPEQALDNLRGYLGDKIAEYRKGNDNILESSWNHIISAAPSDSELKKAIKTAREKDHIQISDEQEKSILADKDKIPATALLGHAYKTFIAQPAMALNRWVNDENSAEAQNAERSKDFRDPTMYQAIQPNQIAGVEKISDNGEPEQNVVRPVFNEKAGQKAGIGSWATANQVAETAGIIGSYAVLNKGFGAVANKLLGGVAGAEVLGYGNGLKPLTALSAEQLSLASNVSTSVFLNYHTGTDLMKQYTNNKTAQKAYGLSSSIVTGLVFHGINPNKIYSGEAKAAEEKAANEFLHDFKNGNGNLNPTKFKEWATNFAVNTAKDLGHNISLVKANQIADIALQAIASKKSMEGRDLSEEIIGNLPSEIISFLPFSMIAGYHKTNADSGIKDAIKMAIADPVKFEEGMQKNVQLGKIKQADADQKIAFVKDLIKKANSTDLQSERVNALPENNKFEYAVNLTKEANLKNRAKDLTDKLQIDQHNKGVDELQSQRKIILLKYEIGDKKYSELSDGEKDNIELPKDYGTVKTQPVKDEESDNHVPVIVNKKGEHEVIKKSFKTADEAKVYGEDRLRKKYFEENISNKEHEIDDILADHKSNKPKDVDTLIKDAKDSGKLGVFKDMDNEALLKMVAEQAQNLDAKGNEGKPEEAEMAMSGTVNQFGKELVDAAIAKYPKAEQPKVTEGSGGVKEGVHEVVKSNPTISEIGTPQEYSEYLKTVFPDSQVKDIVYHGTDQQFDKFNTVRPNGMYGASFTTDKKTAENYTNKNKAGENRRVVATLLDIKNPKQVNYEEASFIKEKPTEHDAYIDNTKDGLNHDEYVVFNPEQIHILGGKSDIEGFKKWKSEQPNIKDKPVTEGSGDVPKTGEPTSYDKYMDDDSKTGNEPIYDKDGELRPFGFNGINLFEYTKRLDKASEEASKNKEYSGYWGVVADFVGENELMPRFKELENKENKTDKEYEEQQLIIDKLQDKYWDIVHGRIEAPKISPEQPNIKEQINEEPQVEVLNPTKEEGVTDEGVNKESGAAKEREGQVGQGEVISITHTATDAVARELGLSEYEQSPETIAEWDVEVNKRLAENPNATQEMMDKYRAGGKIDKYDQRMMLKYHAALKARINESPTPENIKAYNEAKRLSDIEGGREVAKSLVARKGNIPVEDDLANFLVKEANAAGVETLPQETINELKKKYDADQEVIKQLNGRIEQLEKDAADKKIQEEVKKASKSSSRKTSEDFKNQRTSLKDKLKQQLADYKNEINKVGIADDGGVKSFAITVDMAKTIGEYAKTYIEEGVTKLADIVAKLHDEIKDVIPEISERDIRDVIAGKYVEQKKTRNEIAAQMRDIKLQQQMLDKIEKLEAGIKLIKDPIRKQKASEELEGLREKFNDLGGYEKEKTDISDEQKLKAYKTGLKNKTAKLKKDLETGDYLKDPEPKKPLKLDAEAEKLLDEHIKFVKETTLRRQKAEFEQRSRFEKAYDAVMQVTGIKRIVQTAVDLSIPFRQGVTLAFNPRRWATFGKSFGAMLHSTFSPKNFDRMMYAIHQSPDYQNMLKDKVHFNEMDAVDSNSRNEEFQKSFVYKIPILREPLLASNRAADGFLNTSRYDMYMKGKRMLERQGITRDNSPESYEALGKWVMNITGRGNLLKAIEDSHQGRMIASNLFFGARLMASRFNLLNPIYYAQMPPAIRREALKDMATFTTMIMATALAAQAAGAKVSTNPDDADFLKIKTGNTRYDITGGLSQYIRTYLRVNKAIGLRFNPNVSTDKKNKYAKYAINSVVNFFQYKLAPNTSYGLSAIRGTDPLGKDFNPTDALKIYPMYVDDMVTGWKQDGVTSLATIGLPSIFGVGVQTYQDKNKKGYIKK